MDATLTAYTVTTFLVMAHNGGFPVAEPGFSKLVERLKSEGATEALGNELVEVVRAGLGDGSPDAVIGALKGFLGNIVVADAPHGDSREARLASVRRALFGRSTPWLAWVIERNAAGQLHPQCLLVEDFGEDVAVMDPNPFNEIDEARRYAIPEFLAIWELAGCRSVSLG